MRFLVRLILSSFLCHLQSSRASNSTAPFPWLIFLWLESSLPYLRNKWLPQELKAAIIYVWRVLPCLFSSLETGVVSTVDGCAPVTWETWINFPAAFITHCFKSSLINASFTCCGLKNYRTCSEDRRQWFPSQAPTWGVRLMLNPNQTLKEPCLWNVTWIYLICNDMIWQAMLFREHYISENIFQLTFLKIWCILNFIPISFSSICSYHYYVDFQWLLIKYNIKESVLK